MSRQSAAHAYIPGANKELKPWHPDKLSQRHRLVILLHAAGMRNNEIAEYMNYSESRVSTILNDPRSAEVLKEHASEVADAIDDVRLRLSMYANEALDEIVDEMRHCEDPRVRQRAAFSVLDRAGYGQIEKKVVAHGPISEQAASELREALGESDGEVIDAEYSIEGESDE